MASTAAGGARRPSFEKKRSTSTINLTGNDEESHVAGHPRQHKKFVVHASRHHSRVPSYGRNLNKLNKLTAAHDSATSLKGHNLERGGSNGRKGGKGAETEQVTAERPPSTGKKPAFEIGDSGEDTANEESVEVTRPPVKKSNGIKKSSSTKSLERQLPDALTFTRQDGPSTVTSERRQNNASPENQSQTLQLTKPDMSRVEQGPLRNMSGQTLSDIPKAAECSGQILVDSGRNNRLFSQNTSTAAAECSGQTLVDNGRNNRLFSQTTSTAAAPPQLNAEYATGLHTSTTSSTGFPNNQAITSRFIDSPGRSGASNSLSPGHSPSDTRDTLKTRPTSTRSLPDPSKSQSPPLQHLKPSTTALSTTSSIPSRTLQKQWLQRQFDEDAHVGLKQKSSQGNSWSGISQKELERIGREFSNVRKFKDPVGEALNRIRDHPKLQRRIPRKGSNGAAQEIGMGLSQSLNAGMSRSLRSQDKGPKGSRDDSGLDSSPARDPNLQRMLDQMWNQPHLLTSNE